MNKVLGLSFFLILTACNHVSQNERIKQKLISPNLSSEKIIEYRAGVRPYRTGGVRIEPEYYEDWLIIHDYGHGGSGISMSWGSAMVSYEMLYDEVEKRPHLEKQPVAIIGSGIIGLTTALLLSENGWPVSIYAETFPPYTTSDVAPGLWNNAVIDEGKNDQAKQLHKRIMSLSYKRFKSLSRSWFPEFKGVRPLKIYTFKISKKPENYLYGLTPEGVETKVYFPHKKAKKGVLLDSFLIDTTIYIPSLVEKAQKKGIPFISKRFRSKEEFRQIPEKIIFNCTGMGSKELFSDDTLIPVRGQLIDFSPQQGLDYMLAGPIHDNLDLYIIPLKDKFVLGGSYEFGEEKNEVDYEKSQMIIENAKHFFTE